MLKILTNNSSFPSAKLLRNPLQDLTKRKVLVTSKPEKITSYPFIRYGNSYELVFPLLIRETLTAFGCKGIHVIKNQKEFDKIWRSNFYWTKYVPLEFELRVHVLGKKIARVFRKNLNEKQEYPIRNNAICHFSLKSVGKYPKLEQFIKTLTDIKEIGAGKFYSIDIGWDTVNKKYFVIELNTGSGLNENTADLYAKYIYDNLLGD
jgi:hypothetical protein